VKKGKGNFALFLCPLHCKEGSVEVGISIVKVSQGVWKIMFHCITNPGDFVAH